LEHTRASKVNIGERRNPQPLGRPGFLRVDTVHQGSQDGRPGLYHINAVDTVRLTSSSRSSVISRKVEEIKTRISH
jgi:hypothetical protein